MRLWSGLGAGRTGVRSNGLGRGRGTGGSCKEGVGFAVTREKKYDDGDGANFVNVF